MKIERRKQEVISNIALVLLIGMIGYFGTKFVMLIDQFPIFRETVTELKTIIAEQKDQYKELIKCQNKLTIELTQLKTEVSLLRQSRRLSISKLVKVDSKPEMVE
jgi:hypothetical protein